MLRLFLARIVQLGIGSDLGLIVGVLLLGALADDARHFEELRRLELLHDHLQLRGLDQVCQLIEALSAALYLVHRVRNVQVRQGQHEIETALRVHAHVLLCHVDGGHCLQRLVELAHFRVE